MRESGGAALTVTDGQLAEARSRLATQGMWTELSAAAGLAGHLAARPRATRGPVVCVATSSGFKDTATGTRTDAGAGAGEPASADWAAVRAAIEDETATGRTR